MLDAGTAVPYPYDGPVFHDRRGVAGWTLGSEHSRKWLAFDAPSTCVVNKLRGARFYFGSASVAA